jgi:activator of 2-hydroxyglutaryl-CoA dehydratase
VNNSTQKIDDMKAQMAKLRKKGKFTDYKEIKQELLREMKEADAVGVDLGKSSKTNSLIIKEIIGIYFDILKNKNSSPLLKSVFLGLPQFTQYINIELVWDLIAVMTEYLKEEVRDDN